jgi:cell division protein FtsL
MKQMSEEIQNVSEKPLTTSSVSPPKLNLRRLERIQTVSQYLAGFVLLIFIVSIVISYIQLRRIRHEIAKNQEVIDSQRQQLKSQEPVISGLQQVTLLASEANPNRGEEAKRIIEGTITQSGQTQQLPPRIYIQIAREDQRKRAADVASRLQAKGYIVPGIENVEGKVPSTSQVRYCPTDRFEEDLADITKTLESIKISVGTQRLANCGNVRPRLYELWFGEKF